MKELCLGTAMWGWSVSRNTAYSILDCFYAGGGRHIDTANNYPLNGKREDYRSSAEFIAEWCRTRGVKDLKVTFKVGSISNKFSPQINLLPTYLEEQISWAENCFSENLHCVMIHWDNRDDTALISETLGFLKTLKYRDLVLGLSGILYPDVYKEVLFRCSFKNFNVQVKHNFLYSDLKRYEGFADLTPKFWAYGISASGLKLSTKEYADNSYVSLTREEGYHDRLLSQGLAQALHKTIDNNRNNLKNLYHIAMAYSELENNLYGYLVAPTKLNQMQDILEFTGSEFIQQIDLSELMLRELKE